MNEAYHVYNRAAHKIPIFLEERDYDRFLVLLHLTNNSKTIDVRNSLKRHKDEGRSSVFADKTDRSLVDVLAYSLLPNHFHLVLRQKSAEGITRYLRRVATGYSMYFNLKYDHIGTLFQGRFRSSHLDNDSYFKWIFAYVHLNPVAFTDPEWHERGIRDIVRAQTQLQSYRYSSYYDYYTGERPERAIIAYDEAADLVDRACDLQEMLAEFGRGRVLHMEGMKDLQPAVQQKT